MAINRTPVISQTHRVKLIWSNTLCKKFTFGLLTLEGFFNILCIHNLLFRNNDIRTLRHEYSNIRTAEPESFCDAIFAGHNIYFHNLLFLLFKTIFHFSLMPNSFKIPNTFEYCGFFYDRPNKFTPVNLYKPSNALPTNSVIPSDKM